MRISVLSFFCLLAMGVSAQQQTFFVGTYTGSGSKGIYAFSFDGKTGTAQLLHHTDSGSITNPSFLAFSPTDKYLYAVAETGGNKPGAVYAYSVDDDNKLQFINSAPSGGDHPCYVAVHKSGDWVLAGNYSGGNFTALQVNEDGSLKENGWTTQHKGSGPNTARQEKAHVHATVFSPDHGYVFVPDLGIDKVHIYRFDPESKGLIQPATQPFANAAPGSGPRHFTFHPNGRFAYLMEELGGTVSAYAYNKGKLRFLQRTSSHPAGYKGAIGSADIHVSPDGKFLYASNRGDANSIAVFSIGASGKLKWVEAVPSGGQMPRNFAISPDGKFVLVAHQQTDNIVIFRRNTVTGKLSATGQEIRVPKPVCVVFKEN